MKAATLLAQMIFSYSLLGCASLAAEGHLVQGSLPVPKHFMVSSQASSKIVFEARTYNHVDGYCIFHGLLQKVSGDEVIPVGSGVSDRITPISIGACASYSGSLIAILGLSGNASADILQALSANRLEFERELVTAGGRGLADAFIGSRLVLLDGRDPKKGVVLHFDTSDWHYEVSIDARSLEVRNVNRWQ